MKKARTSMERKSSEGSRIVASLREAVDWAEGKDVAVRVKQVEMPTVDVRPTLDVRKIRRKLRLSQSAFAAKFGFQPEPDGSPSRTGSMMKATPAPPLFGPRSIVCLA